MSDKKGTPGAPLKAVEDLLKHKLMIRMSDADSHLVSYVAKSMGLSKQAFMRLAVMGYIHGEKLRLVFDPMTRGQLHQTSLQLGLTEDDLAAFKTASTKNHSKYSKFVREILRGKCLDHLGADKYNALLKEFAADHGGEYEFVADLAGSAAGAGSINKKSLPPPNSKPCEACGDAMFFAHKTVASTTRWCPKCLDAAIKEACEALRADKKNTTKKVYRAASFARAQQTGKSMAEIASTAGVSRESVRQTIAWFWSCSSPDVK